jgi:hypothetical protein
MKASADRTRPIFEAIKRGEHLASIKYPVILHTRAMTTDGTSRPATIEVYPDALCVYGGRAKGLLAKIQMSDIMKVQYINTPNKDSPVAGFAVETTTGEYRFSSEGYSAPGDMRKAAGNIRVTCNAHTGLEVPFTEMDPSRKLTTDNLVHRV